MKSAHMLILLAMAAAVPGCDYRAAVSADARLEADASFAGLWREHGSGGRGNALLVLPINARELLVQYPAGTEDGMFATACFVECAGMRLVQLRWLGTGRGALPDDDRVYQYAACELACGDLRVRLLNADVVGQDAASAEALVEAVATNRDHPRLFREAMVFRKLKGREPGDEAGAEGGGRARGGVPGT